MIRLKVLVQKLDCLNASRSVDKCRQMTLARNLKVLSLHPTLLKLFEHEATTFGRDDEILCAVIKQHGRTLASDEIDR